MKLDLFLTFMKIGAFTFGGGYAMIPLIQKEVVERKQWASEEEILDVVAIAESTPGPIAVNASTFIGYRTAGFWGAVCATGGLALPSFVIILLISYVLRQFMDLKAVQYAFWGIRAGVLSLIAKALISVIKKNKWDASGIVIAVLAFIFSVIIKVNLLYVIIGCGLLGLGASLLKARRALK